MKIKLHYNQFSNGGATECEKWSLISRDEMNYDPFRPCETLKTVEIEIPDTWKIDKENDMIFDEEGYSTCYQELSKDWDKIKVGTYKFPYYKTIWKEGKKGAQAPEDQTAERQGGKNV